MSTGIGHVGSLEQVLDRGTERYARSLQQSGYKHTLAGISPITALALPSRQVALSTLHASPLLWRGLPVSDEFQRYAARVAQGESLAPYRGQVLAGPCADFPWGAGGALVAEEPRAQRSHLTAAWLLSASALVVGVLGLGSVATGMAGGGIESELQFTPSSASSGSSAEALAAGERSAEATPSHSNDSPAIEAASSARDSQPAQPPRTRTRRAHVSPASAGAALDARGTTASPSTRQLAAEQRPAEPAVQAGSSAAVSALLLETPPF